MQLFKIANGPWEQLFSGNFQDHDVELYSNPEKIIMVVVYEKKLDRVEGAIIELYKIFSASGEVESFTETLPRDVLIITKHDENSTMKFLLLGSKPTYARWIEKDFIKEVDSLVKRLSTSAVMIKDVSKAYELTLQELVESPPEIQSAFFSQPLLVPLLSTSSHQTLNTNEGQEMKTITKGDIIIGLTRDKKRVVEPLALFTKTIISEGEEKDRQRILRIFGESALLSNTPCVFFDFGTAFDGIGEANKDNAEIQKYQVQIDPLGFPVKNFSPEDNLKININLLNPEGLAELFGVGDKDFARILKIALEKEKITSMSNLVEKIIALKQTEEFSEFAIQKTARIINLINNHYPKLFGAENDIAQIIKKGQSNLARATHIKLTLLDERSQILLIHSILKEITEHVKGTKASSSLTAMIVIPNAEKIKLKDNQKIIATEIYLLLNEFQKLGIAFSLGVKKIIDINPSLKENVDAQINIISGNDIGVQLKNRKSYRVLARPTLSKSS